MKKIAIIGAGISGLFIANLFEKNPNYEISIYEKNNSINLEEGYGIQLSVNSVKLLNEIGFDKLNEKEKFNPNKIDFYSVSNLKKICELNISDFNFENCRYTTLKRSILINFLKKDLKDLIKTGYSISKINEQEKKIKLYFENNESVECDYLIISDGVFSKSKSLISNDKIKPQYNNSLAIRGVILKNNVPKIDIRNISLFLGSNFHYVVYPINSNGDLNFIGIIKHKVLPDKQMHESLVRKFIDDYVLQNLFKKMPPIFNQFYDNLNEVKVFPIFVSKDFYKPINKNIHFIGDAFFAFPPSFAQGASQSVEGAYELFKSIDNNTLNNYFLNRVKKTKMVNIRSKFNQFAFHLSNSISVLFRNIFLKRLVKNIHFIGDAFFAFPPSFAQGASQSVEGAYELFKSIDSNTLNSYFINRVKKTKMVNIRSKFNQFAFHLSNSISVLFRNIFLKRLVKNKKFLESYLGKIYKN